MVTNPIKKPNEFDNSKAANEELVSSLCLEVVKKKSKWKYSKYEMNEIALVMIFKAKQSKPTYEQQIVRIIKWPTSLKFENVSFVMSAILQTENILLCRNMRKSLQEASFEI